jgi:hypothetical protein
MNDEIADTLARLAIPAAIAAAGVAGTMLMQYHPVAGIATRLGRTFRWRF